jgi:hypothetical protein
LKTLTFRCAQFFLFQLALTIPGSTAPLPQPQRFVCNTGYRLNECLQQLGTLKSALAPYGTEKLGAWTWVLVKSEDWKPIVGRMGGNTDSPAFTVLEKRQTFLEEALFVPAGGRQVELLRAWSVPLDKFLDFAVTHELGHGICNTTEERQADTFGRLLRDGKNPGCQAISSKR